MKNRKYAAECAPIIYTNQPSLISPFDFYLIKEGSLMNFANLLNQAKIYIICSRRRISIDPHDISVKQGNIYGKFRIQNDDLFSYETIPFYTKRHVDKNDKSPIIYTGVRPKDAIGSGIIASASDGSQVNISTIEALSGFEYNFDSDSDFRDMEVLYIGQSFGRKKSRGAIDRLYRHVTYNKIVHEILCKKPNHEVFILLFDFVYKKIFTSSDGTDLSLEPNASPEEEISKINSINDIEIPYSDLINVAEAALINHYKPKYNIIHAKSFSQKAVTSMKTISRLISQDMIGALTEFNTSNIKSRLYSEKELHLKKASKEVINSIKKSKSLSIDQREDLFNDIYYSHYTAFSFYPDTERENFIHKIINDLRI